MELQRPTGKINDNSSDEEFTYNPIVGPNTVRLLQISRRNGMSIVGELQNFSLDAPPATGFTALSYVWGKKAYDPRKILLNGHPFSILESLYPALGEMCDNPELAAENSWWWIDSICIDQRDVRDARSERSSQVQLMGRIYKESKRTVVWLGERVDGNDEAMEFFQILAKSKKRLKSKVEVQGLDNPEKWKSVEKLLLRPWWKRLWTLQEFILAPKLDFYCGSKSISRGGFRGAIYSMWLLRQTDEPIIQQDAYNSAWNRRRLIQWYEEGNGSANRMGLIALMAYVGDCQATDGRDRIYALLGLASDGELAGRPDYESSVDKVYAKLFETFVQTYKSLDVICLAHIFNKHALKSSADLTLPSWVPDWRAHVDPFVVPVMASQSALGHIGNFRPISNPPVPDRYDTVFAASGTRLPEIAVSGDFRVLTCKAILIDHIDGLGGTSLASDSYVQSTSLINNPVETETESSPLRNIQADLAWNSKLIDEIVRSLVLDKGDRYLNSPTPLERFRREFEDLCLAALEKPEEVHPWFRDWFELNNFLYIRGQTLVALLRMARVSGSSQTTNLMKTPETGFISRLNDTTGERKMARRLVTTNDGYIGMAPYRAQNGDLICVLLGCSIPAVLRKCKEKGSYEFIGECYLHGFMNGEALDSGKFKAEDFSLS